MTMKLLILGGTPLAADLGRAVPPGVTITTVVGQSATAGIGIPRIGGFPTQASFDIYVDKEKPNLIIDATDPFDPSLTNLYKNSSACKDLPYLRLRLPSWGKTKEDSWIEAPSVQQAQNSLPKIGTNFLLYDMPQESQAFASNGLTFFDLRKESTRGPKTLASHTQLADIEIPTITRISELVRRYQIDAVILKSTGEYIDQPILSAARSLKIPVILLIPPPPEEGTVFSVEAGLAWIKKHLQQKNHLLTNLASSLAKAQ